MILVDTTVWVDHLNFGEAQLAYLVEQNQIRMHPYVLGEIALGKLRKRKQLMSDLSNLIMATVAQYHEVIDAINAWSLDGSGIGYIDTHLLVSAKIDGLKLWTRNRKLEAQASKLGINYTFLE